MKFEPIHHHVPVGDCWIHIVEAGRGHAANVVFLHGWPEDWTEWRQMMTLACQTHHVFAVDLPGVGESRGAGPGEKTAIADIVHRATEALGIATPTIVGHDAGAMVAYAYLRKFPAGLTAAVLVSSVIPGVAPWAKVAADPHVWHFVFHHIPGLPEAMVRDRQRAYFDYFFDLLSANRAAITDAARDHYASAYANPAALTTGFDWYRAFDRDAEANGRDRTRLPTPVLCVRGAADYGDPREYASGLREVGIETVATAVIPNSGHFTPEENPAAVWTEIAAFLAKQSR